MTNPNAIPDPGKTWAAWRARVYKAYGAGVAVSVSGAFLESFAGLIDWFRSNKFAGIYAFIAPVMVDVFILGGEGLLLLAVIEKWDRKAKAAGWISTITGLAVSIYGNIGRNGWHDKAGHLIPVPQMLSNAAAPAAMCGLLALGLLIIKRHFRQAGPDRTGLNPAVPDDLLVAVAVFRADLDAGVLPSIRDIRSRLACGQDRATRTRAYLDALSPAFNPDTVPPITQEAVR